MRSARMVMVARSAAAVAVMMAFAACTGAGSYGGGGQPSQAPASAAAAASAAPASSPAPTPEEDEYQRGGGGLSDYGTGSSPAEGYEITVATDAKLGKHLTGSQGRSLYVFAKDEPGKSNCSGGCAGSWPPFTLEAGEQPAAGAGVTGALATITRSDGSLQVTYNGAPLYYFGGDAKAGDTNGDGVGGVWSVAKP